MTALTLDPKQRTAFLALGVAAAMLGLGYASVPLYRLFCNVTGYGGTTMRATEASVPGAATGKTIDVRFDANRSSSLPWTFKAEANVQTVKIGARNIAFFTATNLSDSTVTGTATYNVTPEASGQYFNKIQCFCFTQQTLAPGQTVRMPVIFFVSPDLLKDPDTKAISEITLSYTFYPVDESKKAS